MPVVRPTFVGMHDKPASHGFAPTEMRQFAPLGAASAEFSEDRNAAQTNKEKRKRLPIIQLLWQPDLANPISHAKSYDRSPLP